MALGLTGEGVERAEEGLEMYKQAGDTVGQAECSVDIAMLLLFDKQFNAAEDAASSVFNFLEDLLLYQSRCVLGGVYLQGRGREGHGTF